MPEKIDLMKLVIEVDDELFQEGREPSQRPLEAYRRIKQRLEPSSSSILFLNDPLLNDINQIYKELYRPIDINSSPKHIGAFMFRDVFFRISLPYIYGSVKINPVDFLIDLPEIQKQ